MRSTNIVRQARHQSKTADVRRKLLLYLVVCLLWAAIITVALLTIPH